MRIAIMQPYFLPYIGYFQLIQSVDKFVIYDNIKYTKKGWINRNRYILNGKSKTFTIPIKKGSDFLNINQRSVSDKFDRNKFLRQFLSAYSELDNTELIMKLLNKIIKFEDINLFNYILHSLKIVTNHLNISTKIIISSSLDINHEIKGSKKVIEICKALKAKTYINAIGGKDLYHTKEFYDEGINLLFLKTKDYQYQQFDYKFIKDLSIIDVMMFNNDEQVKKLISSYEFEKK